MKLSRLLLAALLALADLPGCSVGLTYEDASEASEAPDGPRPWSCHASRDSSPVRWGERRSASEFPSGVSVRWSRSAGEELPGLDCARRSGR